MTFVKECTLGCFTSLYVVRHFGTFVFSTLDQFLAVGCFEKLGKNAVSRIVIHRQVYQFVYMNITMNRPTPSINT